MIRYIVIAFALASSVSFGQTVFTTANNYNDLNPESTNHLYGPVGVYRIRHYVTDGSAPLDISEATSIRLRVIDTTDGYTNNSAINPSATNSPGTIWWTTPSLLSDGDGSRVYRLQADFVSASDSFMIFDRYLTVTSQVTVATTVSLSLIPPSSNVGVIGTAQLPWRDIYSKTGYVETLRVGTLDASIAINAADTGAVKLVGSTMTGGLTNRSADGLVGNMLGGTNYQAENLRGTALPALSGQLLTGLNYNNITNPAAAGGSSPFTEAPLSSITPTNPSAILKQPYIWTTNFTGGRYENYVLAQRSGIFSGGGTSSNTNSIDSSSTDSGIGSGLGNKLIISPQSWIDAGTVNIINNSAYCGIGAGTANLIYLAPFSHIYGNSDRIVTGAGNVVIGGYFGNGITQSVASVIMGEGNGMNKTTNQTQIGTMARSTGVTNNIQLSAAGFISNTTSNDQIVMAAKSWLLISDMHTQHVFISYFTNINNDGATITTTRHAYLGVQL